MKKMLALLLTLAMCLSLFAACGSGSTAETAVAAAQPEKSEETAAGSAAENPKKIALVFKLQDPFDVWLKHEYEAQGAEFGFEVEAFDYEDDETKFLQITDNIAQRGGYDLVVARTPMMDARNNIKAIQESGAIYFHVSSAGWEYMRDEELCQGLVCGEYGQGYAIGERAAEELPENANVVVLMGVAGKQNSIDRNQGWHDVLDEKRPDVTFLDTQFANWSKEEAMKKMDDWMQTYDRIDGVLSCNDNMATGCVESLLVAGFDDWENMYIYGVDGLNTACDYISKGYMKGSALGDAREYARRTYELFNAHLAGEYDMNSPAWYDFPTSLVDASNVDDMIAYYKELGMM